MFNFHVFLIFSNTNFFSCSSLKSDSYHFEELENTFLFFFYPPSSSNISEKKLEDQLIKQGWPNTMFTTFQMMYVYIIAKNVASGTCFKHFQRLPKNNY